jgi:GAF domain-containing protein
MEAEESLKSRDKSYRIKGIMTEFIESCNRDKDNHIKNVLNASQGYSLKEISDIVLEEAIRLTQSKYCYVAYVDPENGDSVGISFTKMTPECDMYEELGEARFPARNDRTYGGVLGYSLDTGESFYTQDVTTHKAAHGIPKGHTPVKQFLSVPVLSNGKLTGQIVLGNLKRGYTDEDLEIAEKIADFYGIVLGNIF